MKLTIVQTSQEKKESEKVEISEQSKPIEIAIVLVLNPTLQSFTTISNVGDTSPSQPTISPEVVEQLIEPNADISMTDMPIAEENLVQQETLQENEGIQSNLDLQGQYMSMSPKDKEAVESVLPKEKNTIDMGNMDLSSPAPHLIPQILETAQEKDTQLTTDPNQIATDHNLAFTNYVSHLIANKELPLSEHIRLEEFWSSLSENLTVAAYCQKGMKEKRDTIDQFANVSKKLDTMGNNIQHLKDKLHQIDMEKAKLLARLGKLREERRCLLAQKELINHELTNINYDEQRIEAMVFMDRADFLKNQERYNVIDNKWSYFKRLFMEFKSKIR
ncbi:hypothetical protein RHSIM_Rhsim11G0018000 [Rhododendron simsii]|uniref:Uncharacterized protein n=1 Tax=Rhododendron simsii TaxID=118357 RepID=A0A834LB74_RHOSS|nr:hypothetical protein RHSIM_Rhsim11G0018000 [Rhododendron simsii]